MKANISRELEIAIYDYIYLILLVEVLEGKAKKGFNVDEPISKVLTELAIIKQFYHKNRIKVHPVKVDLDGLLSSMTFQSRLMAAIRKEIFDFGGLPSQ